MKTTLIVVIFLVAWSVVAVRTSDSHHILKMYEICEILLYDATILSVGKYLNKGKTRNTTNNIN